MKWMWLAFTAVVAPLVLLGSVALLLHRPGLPPAAQRALDVYLAQAPARESHGAGAQAAGDSVRAARPRAFTQEMSRSAYGEGYAFAAHAGGGRPAPFPVNEIWCVTIGAGARAHTVLLAQHEDMYVAEWLVHEPRTEAQAQAVCR